MMDERPNYMPAHRPPVWLSSADVAALIVGVADEGGDKSTCFDMLVALANMAERERPVENMEILRELYSSSPPPSKNR